VRSSKCLSRIRAEWGAPVADFAVNDEELIFFDSCTLVRLDADSGSVRESRKVCSATAGDRTRRR
jgi:hypothetical protein